MTKTIRFVQFVVTPQAVIDNGDGGALEPVKIEPIVIRASEWDRVSAELPDEIRRQAQAQLDAQDADVSRAG